MANEIIPPNSPFTRAVERARQAKRAAGTADVDAGEEARPRSSPRARLNFIPDDSMLGAMIDRALAAMSRGITWTRGAILNLLV
jgi:hypothetical protein